MTRAGWTVSAAALSAALAGCGQQAPQSLSYVLVELDRVEGSKVKDVLVEISSTVAPSTKLCINVEPENGTPASFVLFRKFGADTAPRATLTVTSFSALSTDMDTAGAEFACPSSLTAPLTPTQTVTFDFCEGEAVKVQINVGGTCDGCNPATEVCAAGLSSDGAPCKVGECCSSAISDACALVQVPTTTSPAP